MARRNVKVGTIKDVSGKVNIAGRDINQTFKTIIQRALTAAEEAARARKQEGKLLAQGVGNLARSLSAQANEGMEINTPYKGLLPYNLNEAEIFYGRKSATRDLLNDMNQGPLTVLHAESGAGKSSLLQAGIAAQLIANGHLALPLRPYKTEPVDFIKRMFLPELTQTPALAGASLREFLRQVCGVLGPKINLYLLLDQFEEFFQRKRDERRPFLESLAECLNDPSLKVRWVLALRAEAFSDLAELEAFGITPFKNTYRLNRLTHEAAREAIIEPAKQYGIVFEPALIDHIVDTLTINDEVTPTHLQLVCSALTDNLPEDKTLTLVYYTEQEGGTEGILRDYLKRQLEHFSTGEQTLAWKILRVLITADRQRAVKTYDEILQELKTTDVSKKHIDTVLSRLAERRLLFTQPTAQETFELAHDYLVKEIEIDPQEQARKTAQELLDQETRTYRRYKTLLSPERLAVIEPYQDDLRFSDEAKTLWGQSKQALQREQRARERRRNMTLAISSAIAIVMSLLAIWGGRSSQAARQQARISRAGELAAVALSEKDSHFNTALLFGVEGFHGLRNSRTEGALLSLTDSHPGLTTYLSGHSGKVSSIAFSPDGKLLASSSDDDTIILWNVGNPSTPSNVATLDGHTGPVTSVAFSPDGKTLAAGNDDSTIALWDVSTRQPIGQPLSGHTTTVYIVAFSPDGKLLASGSYDGSLILWDVSNRKPPYQLGTLSRHTDAVSTVAFSPDGKMLASGSDDNTIILWNIRDPGVPLQLATLSGHTDVVSSIAFSPDGKMLASGSWDNSIFFWDIRDPGLPSQLATLSGHTDAVTSVAFSPDGKMLASGSDDNTIILWNIRDRGTPSQRAILSGHGGYVSGVAFSPDGKLLASGSSDKTVILWSVRDLSIPSKFAALSGHSEIAFTVAFRPDGKVLASGGNDHSVILWSVDNPSAPSKLATLAGHTAAVTSVAFRPDGKVLASGGNDHSVILWSVDNPSAPSKLATLAGHTAAVMSVAFSPDGKTLASGSWDTSIILWNIRDPGVPLQLATLSGHTDPVSSVSFSPDGKLLASGSYDGSIILWDVSDRGIPAQLSTLSESNSFITSVAFSPDGKMLASGSDDRTVTLWTIGNPRTPSKLATLAGHTEAVTSVAFSPDDKRLVSSSFDKTLIYWDISDPGSPSQLATLSGHTDVVSSLAFSPDGKILASGSWDTTIVLWNLDPQSWVTKACQRAGRNFTQAEWAQAFPGELYRITCPQWPEGK